LSETFSGPKVVPEQIGFDPMHTLRTLKASNSKNLESWQEFFIRSCNIIWATNILLQLIMNAHKISIFYKEKQTAQSEKNAAKIKTTSDGIYTTCLSQIKLLGDFGVAIISGFKIQAKPTAVPVFGLISSVLAFRALCIKLKSAK